MKKDNIDSLVKVIVINPPTEKQAEERIKKLSEYLGKIWSKPQNI